MPRDFRLWRKGGLGHPEAEAAIHCPSSCSGRKVLESIFLFFPEICMFNHKGKRNGPEQLLGLYRICQLSY